MSHLLKVLADYDSVQRKVQRKGLGSNIFAKKMLVGWCMPISHDLQTRSISALAIKT